MRAPGPDQYRHLRLQSDVGAADRHGLIALMFGELRLSLTAASGATVRNDRAATSSHAARALSILAGLSQSLDHGRGGEVAALLAATYAQASGAVMMAMRSGDAQAFAAVRDRIGDVADAWSAIAPGKPHAAT